MERLTPKLAVKLDRMDLLLAAALVVTVVSYTLGYRLDWSQLDQDATAEASVAATPSGPARAEILRRPPAASEAPSEPVVAPAPAPAEIKASPAQPEIAADPRDEEWEAMTAEIAKHAARHSGRVAIVVKDLRTNREWTYHENDLFPSASLIKVPVMICVFQKIHDGELSLGQQLTMRRHNRIGGSGSLKWRPDGTKLAVRELLQRMISESDNTATNMLIEAVGMAYLQQQFPKLGLLYTGIYEEGMSLKGSRVAHENYTTAREMSMMMEKIYRGEYVDKTSSALMLDILKHKKAVASRLAKGLPRGWEIGHKTGLLRQACHDSAIIFSPKGDYAITVLTGQNPDYKHAKDFISKLGKITFAHYGAPRYYAKAGRRHLAVR